MGWSRRWTEARARGDAELHRVRVLQIGGPSSVGQPTWEIDDLGSDVGQLHLGGDGVEVAGQRVTVGGWSSSIGGFVVPLAGDVSGLRQRLWAGQPVVYEIGYPGAGWEPVAIGTVYDLSRRRMDAREWRLECRDLVGSLQSRMEPTSTRWALFADLGATVTIGPLTAYAVGDSTITLFQTATAFPDATVIGLGRETGQPGAVILRPDDDRRFLRSYTGLGTSGSAPNDRWVLTGVSTSSASQWQAGTPIRAAAGSRVQPVALLTGHPLRVALRILASTGTGANGPDDVYPESWGFGIPHELIDREDALAWLAALHDDSVNDRLQWALVVEEPQPDGLEWLGRMLARVGMWLTMRQGRITVRGAWAVQDPAVPPAPMYGTLSEYDLVDSLEYREFTGGVSAEAYRLTVLYEAGEAYSLVDVLRGRPAVETVEVDLSDWLRREGTTGTLPDVVLTARRLASWTLRRAKALRSVSAHRMAAGLAPGDPVMLDEGIVDGQYDDTGLRGRPAMVVSVDTDWSTGRTRIALAVPGLAPAPDEEA